MEKVSEKEKEERCNSHLHAAAPALVPQRLLNSYHALAGPLSSKVCELEFSGDLCWVDVMCTHDESVSFQP